MARQCSSCLVHFKNTYFYYISTSNFEIITFKWIRIMILEQEAPMFKLLIFFQQMISVFTPRVSYSKANTNLNMSCRRFQNLWTRFSQNWSARPMFYKILKSIPKSLILSGITLAKYLVRKQKIATWTRNPSLSWQNKEKSLA